MFKKARENMINSFDISIQCEEYEDYYLKYCEAMREIYGEEAEF